MSINGSLDKIGKPVLGTAVLLYVVLDMLGRWGVIQAAPLKTSPQYQSTDLKVIRQIDEIHEIVENTDRHLIEETEALTKLFESLERQTRSIDKLVYQLEQERN